MIKYLCDYHMGGRMVFANRLAVMQHLSPYAKFVYLEKGKPILKATMIVWAVKKVARRTREFR
jgi:hypothetical protein